MVRGKKNFLPPAQLLLGFGVVFQISDESKAKHVKHRLHNDIVSIVDSSVNVNAPEDAIAVNEDYEAEDIGHASDDDEKVDGDNDGHEESQNHEGPEDHESSAGEEDVRSVSSHVNPLQSQSHSKLHEASEPLENNAQQDIQDTHENSETHDISSDMQKLDIDGKRTTNVLVPLSDDNADTDEEIEAGSSQAPTTTTKSEKKGQPVAKRGKKGKAKKIATKYKYQDEEDRIAAQKLIGAAAGHEKAEAEAKIKAQHEAELAFQKERRKAQQKRTMKETAEHEEVRKLILDEGVEILEDDEAEKTTVLDAFVGTPLPGDEIMEAIPVCAPWAAMGRYKYKAKVQPGAQKKGKAVKDILGRWLADAGGKGKVDEDSKDTERMWPREVDLIRGWKAEEVINTVPVSKVRVMMAGGSSGAVSKGAPGKSRGGKGSKKR